MIPRTGSVAVVVVLALAMAGSMGQVSRPSTVSRVKTRQKFNLGEMERDLFTIPPVVQKDGVTIRQLTEKEMPVLSTLLPLEQVQLRLIDMQPCSGNVPTVSPRNAVFSFGLSGTASVGVVQNRAGKVLNTIQKEQSTFFPPGMVYFEANLDCQPSRVLQALASIRDSDIFPESQLVAASTAQIADQFQISAQEAAALKSAAQANAGVNTLDALLSQCRSRCANNQGGGNGNGNGNGPGSNNGGKTQPPIKRNEQGQPKTPSPGDAGKGQGNGGKVRDQGKKKDPRGKQAGGGGKKGGKQGGGQGGKQGGGQGGKQGGGQGGRRNNNKNQKKNNN